MFLKANQNIDPKQEMDDGSQVWTSALMLEICVLLMVPIPFYDTYIATRAKTYNDVVYYFLSEFLMAAMCLRLFFLVRTIFNYSIYTDPFSKKLCETYGFTSGVSFTFKCQLLIHPINTVITIFFLTIFISAYLIRLFEMPYYRALKPSDDLKDAFDSYFNSVWVTVITLTTVGYGDLAPCTFPGRIITMMLALWGTLLVSLLVVTISSIFDLT